MASAPVATTAPGARRFERRIGPFLLRLPLGQRLLDVLEGELELIGMGRLLRAPAEQGPRCSSLMIARRCSFCSVSLAAVARSAMSRALSVATSSGSGAASGHPAKGS